MTKRKTKQSPKSNPTLVSTPRKGLKSKQRKVQEEESPISERYPESLKQKKLDFAVPTVQTDNESTPPPSNDSNQAHIETNTDPAGFVSPQETPPNEFVKESITPHSECRYKITLVMPPVKEPSNVLPTFCTGFKTLFDIIQNICKPHDIWLGPWNPDQTPLMPTIKSKKDIPNGKLPSHRQKISAYFGGYISPNPKGETMYSKLRFITTKNALDLTLLGPQLRGAFYSMEPDWQVSIPQNPLPCQAVRSTCIGWLFGSTKYMNEKSFIPAIRKSLQLPEECHIGMQWRVITTPTGKRPPYDSNKSSPSAIHLDVDETYAPHIAIRASELWCSKTTRAKHPKRLPNDVQLRLIPCFSNISTRARSDDSKSDMVQMAEKQHYLCETVLQRIEVPFIRLLDTELSTKESITLRRLIMAKSPATQPTKRLVHNVDFNWNGTKVVMTTPTKFFLEATQFAHNLIPELRHQYGENVHKWFTAAGVHLFKDHIWNPESAKCVSKPDQITRAILNEDIWEIGEAWKQTSNPQRPDLAPESSPTPVTFSDDSDIRSFASAFHRQTDDDSTVAPSPLTKTGGIVQLSLDTLQELSDRQTTSSKDTDTLSMSTAAKTTESTRLKLKETKDRLTETTEVLDTTKASLAAKENEIEELRQKMNAILQRHETLEFIPPKQRTNDETDQLSQTSSEVVEMLTRPPSCSTRSNSIPYAPYPPPPKLGYVIPPETSIAVDLTQSDDLVQSDSNSTPTSSDSSSSSSTSMSSSSTAHSRTSAQVVVDLSKEKVGKRA